MPATPNILLQNAAQAKAQAASAKSSAMAVDAGNKASSFAKVFADQGSNKPAVSADNSVKSTRDKVADTSGKKDVGTDQSAAPKPAVADSGKALPADKAASSDDKAASDDGAQTPVADATVDDAAVVDPALDPALAGIVQPTVTAPVVAAPVVTAAAPAQDETPEVAVLASMVKDPAASTDSEFDPSADPLDSLPAVRMAMEQGAYFRR